MLARAAQELAGIGLLLPAAEAYTQAVGAYRGQGRRAAALACTARAGELLAACAGAQTPILAAAETMDAHLTPRQREVAELAARGASNREIADRLFTSVRTIEGHLLRAFVKLGISRREELPAALGMAPLRRT